MFTLNGDIKIVFRKKKIGIYKKKNTAIFIIRVSPPDK